MRKKQKAWWKINEYCLLRKTCITIRREKANYEPLGKNVLT